MEGRTDRVKPTYPPPSKRVNYFNSAAFYAPVPSQEFLASVCIVSFSLSVYFYVAGVYKGNYFAVPVYNVLGPAALWCECLLVVH